MIPCYVDLLYPEVGIATLQLLEKLNVDVVYPPDQTCCGQPMANSGCYEEARATEELFIKNFCAFDLIVTPSSGMHPIICGINSLPCPIHRSDERSPPASSIWWNFCTTF